MKYPDFSEAIQRCLEEGRNCKFAQSDVRSAFCNLGICPQYWRYLIMKAKSPFDNKFYYFVVKCLPFGGSISCSHFQRVSNAIAHIVKHRTGKKTVNYLDDYLFIAFLKLLCNNQVKEFLSICEEINLPISEEKTFWRTRQLTFLGFLIDTINQIVSVPKEKTERGIEIINEALEKKRSITLKKLQKICGFLNFLCRCITPGRAFTRRLYSYTAGDKLKPHHHIRLN